MSASTMISAPCGDEKRGWNATIAFVPEEFGQDVGHVPCQRARPRVARGSLPALECKEKPGHQRAI